MEKPKNSQYSEIINFDHVNIGFKIRESLWKATMTFLPPPPTFTFSPYTKTKMNIHT